MTPSSASSRRSFDPAQSVLVSDPVAPPPAPAAAPSAPGTAEILKYSSRRIDVKTGSTAPSILLFNDRYDPIWSATVDGKPATVLRCNYAMRGVQVPAGDHTVVFQYQAKADGFFLTLGSVALGLILCAWLVVAETRDRRADARSGSTKP